MATVKLEDVIDVEIYRDIRPENNPTITDFWRSGIVVRDSAMDAIATGAAELVNFPYWRDIDISAEPDYSDNSDTRSTPDKIQQASQKARRAHMNKSWAARDLTSEMTLGAKAMSRIRERTGYYWNIKWQERLVATVLGMYRANIQAGNAGMDAGFGVTGDMVSDISTDDTVATPITDFHRFNSEAFNNSLGTLGDRRGVTNTLLVHSVVYNQMVKDEAIEFVPDSEFNIAVPTYQGHRVIMDDSAPVIPVTTGVGNRYVCVMFGPAVFGYGEGVADNPVEVWRDPSIGNGGGETVLFERKTQIIHPFGHSNLEIAVSGGNVSQTLADLGRGDNWKRNLYRKNVPVVFFVVNG